MNDFFQDPPVLQNTFTEHRWLARYLKSKFPKEMQASIFADLLALGAKCAGEYSELGRVAERDRPQLVQFDPWGRRVDEIRVSPAWTELQNISAREGMIAIGYQRAMGEYSRLYQFSKLYLFHPASAFFTCPLAMADGAARVLELYGQNDQLREAFRHLTTRDPKDFWTSGQWMTEKTGGSDVSQTQTEVRYEKDQARLFGVKWFSSSTTSEMALALARCPGAAAGSKGLTLFWVPTRNPDGQLNNIRVLRLKDKLGTWALPTAELSLEGALAYQVGERDQGVKTVATMLNITRLYNSVCSIGQMTRGLDLMFSYADRREVFGAPLSQQVLHQNVFAREQVRLMAGFLLTMELVHLLGKEECGTASEMERDVLRLMTPVCKLFTARAAVDTASQVVEGFGGSGYVEDTGIPVHLRDSQVFAIWEGATNVLSLDLLRVIQKSTALTSLETFVQESLRDAGSAFSERKNSAQNNSALTDILAEVQARLGALQKELQIWSQAKPEVQVAGSRSLAFHLGWTLASVWLMRWAARDPGLDLRAWLCAMFAQSPVWRSPTAADIALDRQVYQGRLDR